VRGEKRKKDTESDQTSLSINEDEKILVNYSATLPAENILNINNHRCPRRTGRPL